MQELEAVVQRHLLPQFGNSCDKPHQRVFELPLGRLSLLPLLQLLVVARPLTQRLTGLLAVPRVPWFVLLVLVPRCLLQLVLEA